METTSIERQIRDKSFGILTTGDCRRNIDWTLGESNCLLTSFVFLSLVIFNIKIGNTVTFYNFTIRYIDGALFINNSNFSGWVLLKYPQELEIKEITDTCSLPHVYNYTSN